MDEALIRSYYLDYRMSVKDIALLLNCSTGRVDYWLAKYHIEKRSLSDAAFAKKHGATDGFAIKTNLTLADAYLFGQGVGIYWGEGNRRNKHAVRVGNTDPGLLRTFVKFLKEICGVDEYSIRYGLQIFSDISPNLALVYWQKQLNITRKQIMPTVNLIKSGKIGTYKVKNQYGVMTVYVFNMKLRNWLVGQLDMPR